MHDAPTVLDAIIDRAAAAVAKVDLHGRRGLTLLSIEEIEALVLALVILCQSPQQEKIQ